MINLPILSDLLRLIQETYGYWLPTTNLKEQAVNIPIRGIEMDSRRVQVGELFVALTGGTVDGHRFIPDAIDRGAVAIVGEQPMTGLSVPYLQVPDSRQALALLAAAWHRFPARQLTVVGVTGTDGKTTTATLIYHIMKAAGIQAGMISTVNAFIGERILDTGFHVTTPEALDVQSYLAQMTAVEISHVVIEATSHGLVQRRVAACDFDIGVVTNITHEHLDYHGSYQAYCEAKGILFRSLAETQPKPNGSYRIAVLNGDDASYGYLTNLISEINRQASLPLRMISYGLGAEADINAANISQDMSGLHFEARWRDQRLRFSANLTGLYNVSNFLAALGVTILGLGLNTEAAQEGLQKVTGIPGRMEKIEMGQDFSAYVDFAHTPNALRQALISLSSRCLPR